MLFWLRLSRYIFFKLSLKIPMGKWSILLSLRLSSWSFSRPLKESTDRLWSMFDSRLSSCTSDWVVNFGKMAIWLPFKTILPKRDGQLLNASSWMWAMALSVKSRCNSCLKTLSVRSSIELRSKCVSSRKSSCVDWVSWLRSLLVSFGRFLLALDWMNAL